MEIEEYKTLLGAVERPSRYIGQEINSIVKDHSSVQVKVALVFPDTYEVGMSHVGLRILYHLLNSQDWILAERLFSPWFDMEKELRSNKLPPVTLESRSPLQAFDVIGFSIQHELAITNILAILELSRIPFFSKERKQATPLIIAGGPACFNPEPFAEIFDAILIGDGEEALLELCKVIVEHKSQGSSKDDLLKEVIKIKGFYVPRYFIPHYEKDRFICVEPVIAGYEAVEKALVTDLDEFPIPIDQIVPYTQLVHDRLVLEISRGCGRGCRFCQAGMIYRPVRERNSGKVLKAALEGLKSTGYEEISLLSLSSGDYSCIEGLLKTLMDVKGREYVGISLPSLRIDSLSPSMVDQIKRVRKTGFTLAPETGSEELRKRINKDLSNQEILEISQMVFEAGWNLLKLYFMVGLPYEGVKDLKDTAALIKELGSRVRKVAFKRKKVGINVNISCFVPKSHTPFMWEAQITEEEMGRRMALFDGLLKDRVINFKGNAYAHSWLEGVFSRGDRRLLEVAMEAFKSGARFDAWGDYLDLGIWRQAFKRLKIDPAQYHMKRHEGELMPWSHLTCGVSEEFLRQERAKAEEGIPTLGCLSRCGRCGVCDFKGVKPRISENTILDTGSIEYMEKREPIKYRVWFTKLKDMRYLGHLEMMRVILRAFRRAGLPLCYSSGFHPMPKVSFYEALPLGFESTCEVMDVELLERSEPKVLKKRLNDKLPKGIKVLKIAALDAINERDVKDTRLFYIIAPQQLDLLPSLKPGEMDARDPVAKGVKVLPCDATGRRFLLYLNTGQDGNLSIKKAFEVLLGDWLKEKIRVIRIGTRHDNNLSSL